MIVGQLAKIINSAFKSTSISPKLTSSNLTKRRFLIDDLNYEIAKQLAESFSIKALKSFVESIKHHR